MTTARDFARFAPGMQKPAASPAPGKRFTVVPAVNHSDGATHLVMDATRGRAVLAAWNEADANTAAHFANKDAEYMAAPDYLDRVPAGA